MKVIKKVLIIILIILAILLLVIGIAFGILKYKTNKIQDDYSSIYNNDKYKEPVQVDNVEVFKQDVSCGYAVIEMFSKWNNGNITEQSLYNNYGKVVTSTGKAFEKEMNKQFPEYKTTMYKYLNSSDLIDKVYTSLSKGIPVPVEWAAKYENEWTLHYSLITGLDVPNNKVTIANPYGYTEKITIEEFINRTTFESYENMPLFLKFAFAFGIFEKNTIYIVEKK
ncbi:MAG: C39 family peptidase [Bacilli bacterium]|nr:C39 family peptidase [Bacilli bacterium]